MAWRAEAFQLMGLCLIPNRVVMFGSVLPCFMIQHV